MDSPGPRSAVSFLVTVLRRITRAAKVLPFLYLLVFGLTVLGEAWVPEDAYDLVNSLLYVPPSVIVLSLFLSRLLKLCVWHKTACLFPLFSRIEGYIDEYLFQFTQEEIIVINTIVGVAALTFIILAYKHFFHGAKARNNRSPQVLDIQVG